MALVESVNDAMTALSRAVTTCVDAGGKVQTCQCSDRQDVAALRKAYATSIEHRPQWKDQLLSYQYVNKGGRNISGTLVMANLRQQLVTLKCE